MPGAIDTEVAESVVIAKESEILKEVDTLGIAENTVIVVMGDNGPFMQYAGPTGQSDRIYRGGKTEHLEGGVRNRGRTALPSQRLMLSLRLQA